MAVIVVAVLVVTVAEMPLNFTRLFAGVALNPVPDIEIDEPAMPTPGVKDEIANGKTRNSA